MQEIQAPRDIPEMLRASGLRPTRQRQWLAEIIFAEGDRHITAETLHSMALAAGMPVALATVYNTLHQFSQAGLLRAIAADTAQTWFDTNTGDHHHFFVEDTNEVVDMPVDSIEVANLPTPPEGYEISRVDVVVRLRSRQ